MSQLYARIFTQILDSSIAEDFTLRHVFEDFLKLAKHPGGVVDMTREAMSRRLNIPLPLLNEKITILESPDPASRDQDFEGRRIQRLDEHRDWGWVILNWVKYEGIKTKADQSARVARHREKKRESEIFIPPTLEEVKECVMKNGLPESDAIWFWNKCEANGWTNGGQPIKRWRNVIPAWKAAKWMASQRNGSTKSSSSKIAV